MENNRFETLRARLEEQLRADIELLQEAHRVKLRAFETVWRMQADLAQIPLGAAELLPPPSRPAGAADKPAADAPKAVPRPERWSVLHALQDHWDEIPDIFDKDDLARVLGFSPKRATLFRALDELRGVGSVKKEIDSNGRTPARFRKLAPPDFDD